MSAFEGKADMAFRESPLSRSLLGVRRTCRFAAQLAAFDPTLTLAVLIRPLPARSVEAIRCPVLTLRGCNEAARVHRSIGRRGSVATRRARAATGENPASRISVLRITRTCARNRCLSEGVARIRVLRRAEHHR